MHHNKNHSFAWKRFMHACWLNFAAANNFFWYSSSSLLAFTACTGLNEMHLSCKCSFWISYRFDCPLTCCSYVRRRHRPSQKLVGWHHWLMVCWKPRKKSSAEHLSLLPSRGTALHHFALTHSTHTDTMLQTGGCMKQELLYADINICKQFLSSISMH